MFFMKSKTCHYLQMRNAVYREKSKPCARKLFELKTSVKLQDTKILKICCVSTH